MGIGASLFNHEEFSSDKLLNEIDTLSRDNSCNSDSHPHTHLYSHIHSLLSKGIDRITLKKLYEYNSEEFNRSVLTAHGVIDSTKQRQLIDYFMQSYIRECPHSYIRYKSDSFYCIDCKEVICDEQRISRERQVINETQPTEAAKLRSVERGVSIWWLFEFAESNGIWDMPTWMVCREYVLPATQSRRCRYVELESMQSRGVVGRAATYVSHSWAGRFGDLVAAVFDTADPTRRVWIDIFAVRQWPGDFDLDYADTIRECSSFLHVCSAVDKRFLSLSSVLRKEVALLRLWCLAELVVARTHPGVAVIVKCGTYELYQGIVRKTVRLISDKSMLLDLLEDMDVATAECSSEDDRKFLLSDLQTLCGDYETSGELVRAVVNGSSVFAESPSVQAAACGDSSALDDLPDSSFEMVVAASAACGYATVLRMVEEGGRSLKSSETDKYGNNALSLAVINDHLECANILIASGEYGQTDVNREGCNALLCAVNAGRKDGVDLLLRLGWDVQTENYSGQNALMLAAESGNLTLMQVLVSAGCNASHRSEEGGTLLMSAVAGAVLSGRMDCIQYALELGCDVNSEDQEGRTALMFAYSSRDCLEYLVKCGASVNVQAKDGTTALICAVDDGEIESVKFLVQSGADVNCTDDKGRSLVVRAKRSESTNRMECINIIREAMH